MEVGGGSGEGGRLIQPGSFAPSARLPPQKNPRVMKLKRVKSGEMVDCPPPKKATVVALFNPQEQRPDNDETVLLLPLPSGTAAIIVAR